MSASSPKSPLERVTDKGDGQGIFTNSVSDELRAKKLVVGSILKVTSNHNLWDISKNMWVDEGTLLLTMGIPSYDTSYSGTNLRHTFQNLTLGTTTVLLAQAFHILKYTEVIYLP